MFKSASFMVVAGFALGIATCLLIPTSPSSDTEDEKDVIKLQSVLRGCGYSPHQTSDAAWEMYRLGMVSRPTAFYYMSIVKDIHPHTLNCLKKNLPDLWKGEYAGWTAIQHD